MAIFGADDAPECMEGYTPAQVQVGPSALPTCGGAWREVTPGRHAYPSALRCDPVPPPPPMCAGTAGATAVHADDGGARAGGHQQQRGPPHVCLPTSDAGRVPPHSQHPGEPGWSLMGWWRPGLARSQHLAHLSSSSTVAGEIASRPASQPPSQYLLGTSAARPLWQAHAVVVTHAGPGGEHRAHGAADCRPGVQLVSKGCL